MILAVENEVKFHPAFQEAMLVLDESAEEKTGKHSAGAGRQYNGRLGKIEMSQVGVFLALVTPNVCMWIDGELFIPRDWLEDNSAEQQKKVGLPEGLSYQTKPETGWELVKRTRNARSRFKRS